jgi:hypothetical protein
MCHRSVPKGRLKTRRVFSRPLRDCPPCLSLPRTTSWANFRRPYGTKRTFSRRLFSPCHRKIRTNFQWKKAQGLKPHSFRAFSARLKSCPDTKQKVPPSPLSSRPERTRISRHAALDKAACAPFRKEGHGGGICGSADLSWKSFTILLRRVMERIGANVLESFGIPDTHLCEHSYGTSGVAS